MASAVRMVPGKSEGVSRYEDLQIDISSDSQTRVTHKTNLVEGLIQFGSGQNAKFTYSHVIGMFWCKILSSMPVQKTSRGTQSGGKSTVRSC